MSDTNSNRFDSQLRGKANRYRKEPTDQVWEKLQAGMAKSAPRKNFRPAGLLLLGLLLVLLGNMLPRLNELVQPKATYSESAFKQETGVSDRFSGVNTSPAKAEKAGAMPGKTAGHEIKAAQQVSPENQVFGKQQQALTPDKSGQFNGRIQAMPGISIAENKPAAATPSHKQETQVMDSFAAVKPETNADAKTEAKAKVSAGSEAEVPAVFVALLKSEKLVLKLYEATSPEAAENAALIQAIQKQKQELQKLQLRADSLLAHYLPEPAENLSFPSVPDSLPQAKPKNRWSAALALAPELNFMHLSAPAADTLLEMRRNHESGRAGASASLSLEYQLSNKLRVGAGIGYSTYGAELRLTNTQTLLDVRYDTTTQITTQQYSSTHTNYIVQQDSTAIMDPIFNQSGQVIGYNTVYVTNPDTTWHTVVVEGTDTIRTQTITPLIHRTEKTTYRKLKPQYHFVTLPVMLHYRVIAGNRWWAEAGAGGQLQFFRGGTQLVTEDGRTYTTEKVGPKEGPFRPVNLALMGNLSVNYGLTERLSISVAPAVRWQVQSVYKKETGLKQKPLATGMQFGLRYAF